MTIGLGSPHASVERLGYMCELLLILYTAFWGPQWGLKNKAVQVRLWSPKADNIIPDKMGRDRSWYFRFWPEPRFEFWLPRPRPTSPSLQLVCILLSYSFVHGRRHVKLGSDRNDMYGPQKQRRSESIHNIITCLNTTTGCKCQALAQHASNMSGPKTPIWTIGSDFLSLIEQIRLPSANYKL